MPKPFSLIFLFFYFQFFAAQDSKANDSFDWATFSSQRASLQKYISAKLRWLNNKTSDLCDKPLRVIYFHAKDRKPLNHIERWDGILSDIQGYHRSEMRALGYGEVTITLEKENEKLKLHESKERKWTSPTACRKSEAKVRGEVFEALRAKGLNPDKETLLIVCSNKTEGKGYL